IPPAIFFYYSTLFDSRFKTLQQNRNKRLPVTLDEKRQKELQQLKQKYGKSESRIMCIALDLLIAQEKAGFEVPALKK
ncbi:TPA: hypothetical protein IW648_002772, partial [Enterococcus faecium]|nr:hypothetical protein [Enterococcus faecium]